MSQGSAQENKQPDTPSPSSPALSTTRQRHPALSFYLYPDPWTMQGHHMTKTPEVLLLCMSVCACQCVRVCICSLEPMMGTYALATRARLWSKIRLRGVSMNRHPPHRHMNHGVAQAWQTQVQSETDRYERDCGMSHDGSEEAPAAMNRRTGKARPVNVCVCEGKEGKEHVSKAAVTQELCVCNMIWLQLSGG